MRLFLAEKKSLGEAIADGIGNAKPENGKIICGNDVVSWCAGHLFEQYKPHEYDPSLQQWDMKSLPIIPDVWKSKPKESAGRQLSILKELLQQAESVVNCGDPDREGQVLVDEVLEHFGYQGPVQRLWLDDGLTVQAVRRALGKMRDNRDLAPLRDAARARARADWLVGMNCTRALTLKTQFAGGQGVMPVGRVKTPTLALVVGRDLQIENFRPHPYYVLKAQFKTSGDSEFEATYKPDNHTEGFDTEGRLTDKTKAEAIGQAVNGAPGAIIEATSEEKQSHPPLPYSLSALSKEASARFGMTAKQVLDAAQALYLAKLTSYPRTNCRYLPEDQQAEGAKILPVLAKLSDKLANVAKIAKHANPVLKSPAWNSAKQTAHHGIIPTGETPENLPQEQLQIYELICTNYALQFHPPMLYEARTVDVTVKETLWRASGKRIIEAGWSAFKRNETKADENETMLPILSQGDEVRCFNVEISSKMTSPPAQFTDGSLLDAMENVHRHIESAEANDKDILRRTKGIGTDATRATILEELIKGGLLTLDGKKIISTELGRQIVELVPHALKDPLTTAQWESRLEDIADGNLSLDSFIGDICNILPQYIDEIKTMKITKLAGAYPCPECGIPLFKFKNKETNQIFWACHNKENHKNNKSIYLDDKGGKPIARQENICPVCKSVMKPFIDKKTGMKRWGCFESGNHPTKKPIVVEDRNGKAVIYQCPECSLPMIRREKNGVFYWGCWNQEQHKSSKPIFFNDKNGKPELGGKKK